MTLTITATPPPLTMTTDGVVRVGSTRVTLDTVAAAFHQGATPEGIAESYPTLRLADIYTVIGYMLDHADEVETYLRRRRERADEVRREVEARFPPDGIRERLLARRQQG